MYTLLMFILYFHEVCKYCDKYQIISVLIKCIINNKEKITSLLSGLNNRANRNKLLDTIVKYTAYEKRKRMNIIDLQAQALLS